jgi:uridine kinase
MLRGVCVGVAGGSGAGKSTLVARLAERFRRESVCVVRQDDYYRDRSGLSPEERAGLNYDHPDAVESDLLVEQVRLLKSGEAVVCPRYDFATHCRVGEQTLEPGRLLIVEGILVLHWPGLRDLMDVRVYVDAPAQVRLQRRIARDVLERGRTEDSVRRQFVETVQPMHEEFVEPGRQYAGWVIAGDRPWDRDVGQLERHIAWLLRRAAAGERGN